MAGSWWEELSAAVARARLQLAQEELGEALRASVAEEAVEGQEARQELLERYPL